MSFGTASNQQKIATNNLNQGSKVGLDTSSAASNTGFDFLHHAATTLDDPSKFYHAILAGGGQADAALAPDINRTRAAAGQTQQAEENLAPRGGGRASVLFAQPNQVNSQVQSIFNTSRPMAAQGETQLGGIQGQLGGSALGTGVGFLNAGDNASASGFEAGTQAYKQKQEQAQQLASLAGSLIGLGTGGFSGFGGGGGNF